ncbi:Hint domain-containing protein [Octadecabacter sp. 1_MG-2023]|nr:Hint domain-containing protein [Octadecabacter sp. B2R22]MDO6735922.1 Hint domain-containing protein [Octadecabacter sp. 1_MG-2023]
MTPSATAGLAAARNTKAPVASSARLAQLEGRPQRAQPLMRQYEVVHLTPNGDIDDFTRIAPANSSFEDSFGALARGALLKTDRGMVAIEDILPGDKVKTVTNGFQTVYWRGSMTLVPRASGQTSRMGKLIRVAADALGVGRPMPDLLLGPSARLYHRSPQLQRVTGHEAAFVPAVDFVDGVNIVEITPQTPVQVFQIGFMSHERIVANGVEIDSHNPGARHELGLRGDQLALYLTLFPHVERIEDFGMLMHPRLSLHDLDFGVVA